MDSQRNLPPCMSLTYFQFFSRSDSKYLVGNPVLLMPDMRQLVIKCMACLDVDMVIGLLFASEPLLCVEGFQNLVILILVINLPKHLEDLVFTFQTV